MSQQRDATSLPQGEPDYTFEDDDLTPAEWKKAAKFCGFKSVEEYKSWLRVMRAQAGCFLP